MGGMGTIQKVKLTGLGKGEVNSSPTHLLDVCYVINTISVLREKSK